MTDQPRKSKDDRDHDLVERAAIMEFCGNMPRAKAEVLAKKDMKGELK